VARFALGELSIAKAYDFQQDSVWPAALEMSKAAGIGKIIWTTGIGHHFCIAPDCTLETFFSFSMGPHFEKIIFGTPEESRDELQKQNINFFAFDTTSPIFDLLPYSSLFTPDHIRENLAVLWSSEGVYLLTWKSPLTKEIPPEFMGPYRLAIKTPKKGPDFPALYEILKTTYDKWDKKHFPVEVDPSLPRPRGWQ
jgi:hypothetical protein